jgi:hypothetical protein
LADAVPGLAPPRRTARWAALAAGLAAAAAAVWITSDRGAGREGESVPPALAARQREVAELQVRLRVAAEELERARAHSRSLEGILAGARGSLKVASFVLSAAPTRDLMGTVLHQPADAPVVRLELQLLGPPPSSPLDAVIEDAGGREVWRAGGLEASSDGGRGAAVIVVLGADRLLPGEYQARLLRPEGPGRHQPIASYAFQTER